MAISATDLWILITSGNIALNSAMVMRMTVSDLPLTTLLKGYLAAPVNGSQITLNFRVEAGATIPYATDYSDIVT